jgi:hypothetical protein
LSKIALFHILKDLHFFEKRIMMDHAIKPNLQSLQIISLSFPLSLPLSLYPSLSLPTLSLQSLQIQKISKQFLFHVMYEEPKHFFVHKIGERE